MNINCPIMRCASLWAVCFAFFLILSSHTFAQTSPANLPVQPEPTPTPSLEKQFFRNILRDQRAIWLSPFHLHSSDAKWIAPLGLSTAALMATDRRTSGELVEHGDNLTRLRISKYISKAGSLYATGGIAALFYLTGRVENNAWARETGLLG